MGGVGDFLFGKKGKPSRLVDTTPDEFESLRDPFSDAIKSIISSEGGPSFGRPFAASISPNEQALLDRAFGLTSTSPDLFEDARGFTQSTLRGDFLGPEGNPFLRAAIDAATRPVKEHFENVSLPRIRSTFTQGGHQLKPDGSSPFTRALSMAELGVANQVSDISTNMAFGNFQAERGRQQQAAEFAPRLEREELNRTLSGLQATALPRLIEQHGIDRGLQEFRDRVNTLLEALRMAGAASSPKTAVIPGTPGTKGFLGNMAPGFGYAFGGPLGGAIGSMVGNAFTPQPASFGGLESYSEYQDIGVPDPYDALNNF